MDRASSALRLLRLRTAAAVLVLASCGAADAADRGRQLWLKADRPIVVFSGTETAVRLVAEVVGFEATSCTWSQVRDRINPLRTTGTATFIGTGSAVTATLSAPGVYQFRAVARADDITVEGTTWVQVWEDRGPLDPGPTLGTRPGVAPPTSVRFLKPPPRPFDPQRGIVTMRSGWADDATSLWFDCCGSDTYQGHMHAERNSFDFFALGRAWSIAPGYHCTISDVQAAVLIKNPKYANDPASGGLIGESPSSATQRPPLPGNFPTPPGRLLEVTEAADHAWTLVAGDATCCYTFGYSGRRDHDTGLPLRSFLYPGLHELFLKRSPEYEQVFADTLKVTQTDYNPVRHAIRTVLFVRGHRPYALIFDDIDKDGRPHDWRWSMNAAAGQPPIVLESRPPGGKGPHLTYGYDNNRAEKVATPVPSNRPLIERRAVARPDYVVLLFPFRTGESPPETSWNQDHTALRIDLGASGVDTIRFDRGRADHRTRLGFSRATR